MFLFFKPHCSILFQKLTLPILIDLPPVIYVTILAYSKALFFCPVIYVTILAYLKALFFCLAYIIAVRERFLYPYNSQLKFSVLFIFFIDPILIAF